MRYGAWHAAAGATTGSGAVLSGTYAVPSAMERRGVREQLILARETHLGQRAEHRVRRVIEPRLVGEGASRHRRHGPGHRAGLTGVDLVAPAERGVARLTAVVGVRILRAAELAWLYPPCRNNVQETR